MPQLIPITPGDPEQRITTTLDGEQYVLRFRWNTTDDARVGAWYMDAWERDGTTPIVFGVKMVLGTFLGQSTGHALFFGGMFLIDTSGSGDEPRLFDLGGRVLLMVLTVADQVLAGLPIPADTDDQ